MPSRSGNRSGDTPKTYAVRGTARAGGSPLPAARFLIRVAIGATLVARPAAAQGGTDSVPILLRAPTSVRSAGLNGAGAALVGDAGAVFSNPAGIATIRHIALEGAFRTARADAFLVAGALAWRVRQFDVGVGVQVADLGSMPGAFLGPGAATAEHAREVLGVGSLVYRFGLIAVGASAKGLRRSVDSVSARAYSADAGLAIAVFDIMAIGFSIQNIGGNWNGDAPLELPTVTQVGFTMNYVDPQETLRLLSVLEVQWPGGSAARLVLGGEAGIVYRGVGLIGRLAWSSRPTASIFSAATYGATVAFSRVSVDYAYRQEDLLEDATHRVGLRLTL